MEKGEVRTSEKTYRKLTKAMGEEESTRRGVLKTKDIKVLWLTNEITNSFLNEDYEKTELLIGELEVMLECGVKRNQQYLDFVKAKLQYKKGLFDNREYENVIKKGLSYEKLNYEGLLERKWPFCEREWHWLQGVVESIRRENNYEKQEQFLNRMKEIIEADYMEQEYKVAYLVYARYRLGDMMGNIKLHRMAIKLDEETIRLCEERLEWHYLAGVYYDVFWNYQEIKKEETLTVQEEMRCKECLLTAYYLNKALYPEIQLYKQKIRVCYPEELL